ncbi:MAG: Y-family DNA polymerase [Granulosicoccaceae bacterium]
MSLDSNAPATLWLCIGLPALLLDSLACNAGEQPARALVASHGSQRWIHSANREAHAAGVRAQQPVATAMALQPDLQLQAYDEQREHELLQQLALWAYRFSSQLSLTPPAALLLEVGASLRLFGGLPALREQLQQGLEEIGYRHRLGVAPTPLAARLMARLRGPDLLDRTALEVALNEAPIDALLLDEKTRQSLRQAGLRSTGQLLQLPRDALARRFGPSCCDTLDRLRGLADDPQPPFQPPERFEQRLELLQEVENTASLVFPLRRLIETLAAQLIARDCGVKQIALELQHPRLEPTRLPVRLLEPSGDATRLLRVARQQLEQLQLPEPVRALQLSADELLSVVRDGADLFDKSGAGHRGHREVLEQIAARLGEQRVFQLGLRDDHRPECAGQEFPLGQNSNATKVPIVTLPRPLWLLPEPRPAPHNLRLESGPERLESGWWEEPDVRRDYYTARDAQGLRYWVFERRGQPGVFYLHGYFG